MNTAMLLSEPLIYHMIPQVTKEGVRGNMIRSDPATTCSTEVAINAQLDGPCVLELIPELPTNLGQLLDVHANAS